MSTREEVYRALDGECDYQNEDPGIDLSSIDRTLHVILMCIGQHLSGPAPGHSGINTLALLCKVGALCVGSMKIHGTPPEPHYQGIANAKTHIIRSGAVLAPASTGVQTMPTPTKINKTGDQELDAMLEDMGETDGC